MILSNRHRIWTAFSESNSSILIGSIAFVRHPQCSHGGFAVIPPRVKPRSLLILFGTVAVCLLLLPAFALSQSVKPPAAVAPVAAIGDISDAQKQVIHVSLENLLSRSYQLVSQSEYNKAEEIAFQELDFDQCIRAIQEILQVDRLFVLQIIREGDFTQLSLVLVRAEDRLVRAQTCDNCAIRELNTKVEELYASIIADDLAGVPDPSSPITAWRWKWGTALTLGLLTGVYGYTEAQATQASIDEQKSLQRRMAVVASQDEFDSLTRKFKAEQQAGDQHQQNSNLGMLISAVMLGVGAWIYFDPPAEMDGTAMIILPYAGHDGEIGIAMVGGW